MKLIDAINLAKCFTARAAEIKDYKLNTKADKMLKVKAQELVKGKGYIIATAESLGMKNDNRLHIWCYYPGTRHNGKAYISLTMVR